MNPPVESQPDFRVPSPPPRVGYRARIPNALTIARLGLAAAFFVLLSLYQFPLGKGWILPTAAVLFIIAALTDALDGHLARRWRVVTVFGRVMDPLADKVLVLGAFVMLASPLFYALPTSGNGAVAGGAGAGAGVQVSGVQPWMAVLVIARELLVTSIRAVLESQGIDFSASMTGKLKMIVQSIAIPLILVLVPTVALTPDTAGGTRLAAIQAIAWFTTVLTALSALPYLWRAMNLLGPSSWVPPPPTPTNP